MIINSYAVLIAFVAVLRLLAGILVVILSTLAWQTCRNKAVVEQQSHAENQSYLLFLLALLLLVLNLVSWPLLYLLLQSYVPEWPGVMCIYGVLQVGKSSLGPSRFLPDLLVLLQLLKPLIVFIGGLWFVVYLINRRTRTASLLSRLFISLIPLGAFAAVDAGAELAYVAIPKKSEFPSSGCCTATTGSGGSPGLMPQAYFDRLGRSEMYAAFYTINIGLVIALQAVASRSGGVPRASAMILLTVAGIATLAIDALFLVEIAAPTLLRLPYHHCPYDLIPEVPEAMVAVGLFLAGEFFLGWAAAARWLGRNADTEAFLPEIVRNLLRLSQCANLSALLMLSLELILA
jgi:hypothetical protein